MKINNTTRIHEQMPIPIYNWFHWRLLPAILLWFIFNNGNSNSKIFNGYCYLNNYNTWIVIAPHIYIKFHSFVRLAICKVRLFLSFNSWITVNECINSGMTILFSSTMFRWLHQFSFEVIRIQMLSELLLSLNLIGNTDETSISYRHQAHLMKDHKSRNAD